jgi:hypothetical protein
MVSEGLCTAQARIGWADRVGGSEHRQGWAQPEDDEETRLEPAGYWWKRWRPSSCRSPSVAVPPAIIIGYSGSLAEVAVFVALKPGVILYRPGALG